MAPYAKSSVLHELAWRPVDAEATALLHQFVEFRARVLDALDRRLQEAVVGSTDWEAAVDNTGTTIGGTVNAKTVATDTYVRVAGVNAAVTDTDVNPSGGRLRYFSASSSTFGQR